jgi:hypothetical protein
MKKKTIKVPLYCADLILYKCSDISEMESKYDLVGLHGYEAVSFKHPRKDGYSRYIIAFDEDPTINTIAHESLHVVSDLFEDHCIKMDLNNQEPQCYLLGWVTEQCCKFLNKKPC